VLLQCVRATAWYDACNVRNPVPSRSAISALIRVPHTRITTREEQHVRCICLNTILTCYGIDISASYCESVHRNTAGTRVRAEPSSCHQHNDAATAPFADESTLQVRFANALFTGTANACQLTACCTVSREHQCIAPQTAATGRHTAALKQLGCLHRPQPAQQAAWAQGMND
jgi:hypothetical protein